MIYFTSSYQKPGQMPGFLHNGMLNKKYFQHFFIHITTKQYISQIRLPHHSNSPIHPKKNIPVGSSPRISLTIVRKTALPDVPLRSKPLPAKGFSAYPSLAAW
jgi:hypothetical protein